ncbi:MAG TPA: HAD-IA family hydrolase [Candidatus Paceibacterota bacterium]|nr:HAD-IA family hydrolase [Candidatus Paceibacterota bacterium]
MQNNISAVLFDYGGVIELSDFDLINGIVEILGITREKWGDVYYTHNHLTNVEGKSWKEVALIVAEKLGATEDQLKAISTLTEEVNSKKKVNVELVEIIRKLRSLGLKTAVISNYTSILRQKIIEQDIHNAFDEIIISSEEGYQKPNPKLFEVAYKKLGVTASETVFIDDSPSSLKSATELGYTPVLYTDNESLRKALSTLLNISL